MNTTGPKNSPLRRLAAYAALSIPFAGDVPFASPGRSQKGNAYQSSRKPDAKAKRRAQKAGRKASR